VTLAPLLAQDSAPTVRIAMLIGIAIVALIVFGLVIKKLRASLLGGGAPAPGESLDIGELQRQRDAGQISEEEFQSLRRAILGLPPKPAPTSSPSSRSDPAAEPSAEPTTDPPPGEVPDNAEDAGPRG